MIDFKRIFIAIGRFVGVVLVLFLILKALTLIPLDRLSPILGDKLQGIQLFEKSIENFFGDVGATYQQVVFNRQSEHVYEQRYRELLTRQMQEDALLREVEYLRRYKGLQIKFAQKVIPAEVIGRNADNWFQFIEVDKGSAHGIRQHMAVVNEQGLVGYAFDVSEYSTRVVLVTDPQVNISCMNERTGEMYVLRGNLLRPMELKYATLHSDIQRGDVLITSGYSYRFRKGIPIGYVAKQSLPKNKLFRIVKVKPVVDFTKLDMVFFTY